MPNRLAQCTSPYLRQHQENPVDWYPWCDEALERARTEQKPIFLSIGYSACHWCHVMEHESFEDPEIARILNENFICIKVDREERPDLDHVYMAAVQMMTGRGGWPLSVFLTPDLKPFYGGTYWPPESRFGLPGFRQVLESVMAAWRDRREQADEVAQQITDELTRIEHADIRTWKLLDESQWDAAIDEISDHFDARNGGFGGAPKFPQPMLLEAMLRDFCRRSRDRSLEIVTWTLDRMYRGGIFDHLGGGFARYSVDEKWLVPHFEKMLYDNAQLAGIYLKAYQVARHEDFREVVTATLEYLLRDMRLSHGGFAASEDADSEGEEGKFYVWQRAEIVSILGEDADRFCAAMGVTESGNWEGKNILHLPRSIAELAADWQWSVEETRDWLRARAAQLRRERDRRVRPGRDEKVIVSWNAMAVSAFADAGLAFDRAEYIDAAVGALQFIRSEMTDESGRLYHSWLDGVGAPAFADDYAALIDALISVYQATGDAQWLTWGVELATFMERSFADSENGGFFYTGSDAPIPWVRPKPVTDSSVPSANNAAATALARLGTVTADPHWLELAHAAARNAYPYLQRAPLAVGQVLVALDWLMGPAWAAAITQPFSIQLARDLGLGRSFLPRTLALYPPSIGELPPKAAAVLADKLPAEELTLYPCEIGRCDEPRVGVESIKEWLQGQACRCGSADSTR